MKTLSRTAKFFIFPAIAIGAAIALHGFAQAPATTPTPTEPPDPPESHEKFVLKIKPRHPLKDGTKDGEKAFKDLLNNGKYSEAKGNKVHMRHTRAEENDEYLPTGAGTSSKLDIKTDKVTTSQTAKNIEAGELTVIGPHVTIQVASSSPTDIKAVLDQLAP
jgi:hypothetical protein